MISVRGLVIAGTLAAAGLMLIAEAPHRLESPVDEVSPPSETTAIALPPPPESKAPEPPPPAPAADALANLAPESFATDPTLTDAGFGTTFGSGGSGPGIAGGGGFGTGAQALVGDRAELDRPARVLSRAPLEYPAEAKARGVQGHVVLRVSVGDTGAIESVQVAESTPPGFFDEAALRAVRQWRFEPAVIKGRLAMSWITQKITFEMD
jgi:protein TonB